MRLYSGNKKGLSQITAIIILLLIIGIIVVGGYYLLDNKNKKINTLYNVNKPINISNWQIYKNEEYKFSAKYPSDWKQETTPRFYKENKLPGFGGIIIYKEQTSQGLRYGLSISLEENPQSLSAKQWVEKIIEDNKMSYMKNEAPYLLDYKSTSEVKINGYFGYAIFGLNDLEGRVDRLYLSRENKIFVFTYPIAEVNPNYFDPIENNKIALEILTTFKFIK